MTTKKNKPTFLAPGSLGKAVKRPASFNSFCSSPTPSKKQHVPRKQQKNVSKSRPEANDGSLGEHSLMIDDEPIRTQASSTGNAQQNVPHRAANDQEDVTEEDTHVVANDQHTEQAQSSKTACDKPKGRGPTSCKKLAKLKAGEKLPIEFEERRVVGPNRGVWASYLGLVVRNPSICLIRSPSWSDIGQNEKDHMFACMKEYFSHPEMDSYKKDVLLHMKARWTGWRSTLNCGKMKHCESIEEAVTNVPAMIPKEDWEWCVRNFKAPAYKKASDINTINRGMKQLNHHTGSKPTRQLKVDLREKLGQDPTLEEIFVEQYKEGEKIKDPKAIEKLGEIQQAIEDAPNSKHYDLVVKCFGEQNHGHVTCFGGVVKPSDLKGSSKKDNGSDARLRRSEEEKAAMRKRIEELEAANSERAERDA